MSLSPGTLGRAADCGTGGVVGLRRVRGVGARWWRGRRVGTTTWRLWWKKANGMRMWQTSSDGLWCGRGYSRSAGGAASTRMRRTSASAAPVSPASATAEDVLGLHPLLLWSECRIYQGRRRRRRRKTTTIGNSLMEFFLIDAEEPSNGPLVRLIRHAQNYLLLTCPVVNVQRMESWELLH